MEGYGPSAEALLSLRAAGADLVITVDCGTQAFGALQAAADVGLPVIVVDHHKASPELPASLGLINPNRLDESAAASAFGHVCAAGMAFILAVGINRTLRTRGWYGAGSSEPKLTQLLDLVALGTVCDVVPLHGLNRAFVAQGLAVMAKRGNIGLAALADVAGLDRAPTAGALGFHLGPRINAGGRVGQSDLGVRLLTTDDAVLARDLAVQLDALNAERRAIEALVLDQALAAAERSDDPVITVAGEGWHPGVIGIVAGRIKERLGRPALVIGLDGTIGKGSGRSITGVDLGGAVIAAKDQGLLMAGGGHAMAAGLTVAAERVSELAGFLSHRLARDVAAARLDQALDLDGVLNARGVTPELVAAIEQAGPFGAGWPGPRFAIGPVTVAKSDRVGENHVRLILSGADGGRVKAVAFRAADTVLGQELLQPRGRRFAIAGRLVRDDWGEQDRAEVHIDDAAVLG
jgi:single-stranded-DNA-specific exonuclease